MTPFEKLLVAHLVGDWILGQTDWEAQNKGKNWSAALAHGWKWTVALLFGWAWASGWSTTYKPGDWWIYLLILGMGLLHAIIDRRWPTLWLIRAKEHLWQGRPQEQREPPFWLVICVDQVLHIVQVAILASAL